ncbi:MAG: ABC-type transport auxiliary lipoprotein family protein, partial [Pseudomonadota bacterium]
MAIFKSTRENSVALTWALAAMSIAFLNACVSVLPEPTAPDALIQIPASRGGSDASLSADISVFTPEASRALSGVDIAVSDAGALRYLKRVKWADASPRLLQASLVDALTALGGPGHAFSAQTATRADFEVRWRISELSVSPKMGPARVAARVSVLDARTRRVIDETQLRASVAPATQQQSDRAEALAEAAQILSEDAAAF